MKSIEDEREFLKPFKGKDNYIMPNSFVFCRRCNSILLEPNDLWQMATERRLTWQREKVWNKHWQHIASFKLVCRDCGCENFIAIVFLRYTTGNIKRVKFFTVQFDTEQKLRVFLENQRKTWTLKNKG